jgi:hypothetical protein
MTDIRLRRHAPEAQGAEFCSLCGARRHPDETQDNLLAGTPGTANQGGAVCSACGTALSRAVEKFGSQLDVAVEEAQRTASDREITTSHSSKSADRKD